MRIEKHEDDSFPDDMRGAISFFTVLPMILVFMNFVGKLLYEKVILIFYITSSIDDIFIIIRKKE